MGENIQTLKSAQCNIGKSEIRRRYRIGFIGILLSLIVIVAIELTNAQQSWRLIIFIPLFYALSGFIQAWKKFCYVYGIKGLISLAGIKQFQKQQDLQQLRKDRMTSLQIVFVITFGSALLTAAYYYAGN